MGKEKTAKFDKAAEKHEQATDAAAGYGHSAAVAPPAEDEGDNASQSPSDARKEKEGKKLKLNIDLDKFKKMSPAQRDELRAMNQEAYIKMATEAELEDLENANVCDFSGVDREGHPIVVVNNLVFPTKKHQVRRVALLILKHLVSQEANTFNILFVASDMKETKNLNMAHAINHLTKQLHLTMTKNLGALMVLHGSNALKFSIQVMYGNPEIIFFNSILDMFAQVPPYQSVPETCFGNENIKAVSKKKLVMSLEELKAIVERVHGNQASMGEQEAALAGLVGCKLNMKQHEIPCVDEEINSKTGPYLIMNGFHVMKLLHVNAYFFSRALEFHSRYTKIANMQADGADGKRKNNKLKKRTKKEMQDAKKIEKEDYDHSKDDELQHLMFDTSQLLETINHEIHSWVKKEPKISEGILAEGMREELIQSINDQTWKDPTEPEWKTAPFEDKARLTPDQRMKFTVHRLQHEEEVELFKRKMIRLFGGKKKAESFKNRPNGVKCASLGEKDVEVVCAYPGCGASEFSNIQAYEEHRIWHATSHSRTVA